MAFSGSGEYASIFGGRVTPWHRTQLARVRMHAPNNRFMAMVTVSRFSGFSRKELRTQALKAPIAGPHHIW